MYPQHTAEAARLLIDPSRSVMLTSMLDGRYHTSGELARFAGITPQTASFHLKRLEDAGIIHQTRQGRHRYYGLMSPDIAKILESLLTISPPPRISSFKQAREDQAIRYARTCYDHLAGTLAIMVTESLIENDYITQSNEHYLLSKEGEHFFSDFGIDLEVARKKRRSFCPCCLDWSERKHHIAGALGNAMLIRFLELNWCHKKTASRSLLLTETGKKGFETIFGIDIANTNKT
ncbi:DNA-binding transcriptional regulator, ArsR family [Terribacillus aidingensis]|uniref:DNA-binding transcriptional regulator, ArsR family n=1 Tax=Terribacillus aidingensis TaxID=586416 RepID=A0A285MZ91_9BACI|nr:winged helix-turn-helix domain-containing protein [Terribacillus aidingensis]SNZ02515.1 DNA-binding transcriptional regulator, ArsR family [Terribacillus aidingensis]